MIDRAEEGGLPPYVFALMVIYFLQQRKEPILPAYLKQEVCVSSHFVPETEYTVLIQYWLADVNRI